MMISTMKSRKITWMEQSCCNLCVGDVYSTLLSIVLTKLALHQENCDMKLKILLSLTLMEKFLHTIESNEDLEITFDEYVTGVILIVTI